VRQDINAQVNAYKTQNLSSRIMDDAKIAKPSKRAQKTQPAPRELVFYSWWFEEGVRRYLALHYDMSSNVRVLPRRVACVQAALRSRWRLCLLMR
jgi:hypothetical protein